MNWDLSGIRTMVAHGTQFHADELDSAWDTVRALVTPATATALARLGGIKPRQNPADGGAGLFAAKPGVSDTVEEEEEGQTIGTVSGKVDVTVETWRLAHPSMMVTGQWGSVQPQRGGGRFNVINNPSSDLNGDSRPFAARMAALRAELSAMIDYANAKYDARRDPPAAADRGWVKAFTACLEDVTWVEKEHATKGGNARVVELERYRGKEKGKTVEKTRVVSVLGRTKLWGIIAGKGNQKLPFAAYSTLPMSTCPAAGTCSVSVDLEKGKFSSPHGTGYCYSVKAWRYPDAWARQFRNTLGEFADREFAILAGMGSAGSSASYDDRVRAALSPGGRAARTWHQLIAHLVLKALSRKIAAGKQTFLRIYVDGDMNSEDNVVEWMNLAADLGPGGSLTRALPKHVECYGYSKCWNQFVNAGALLGGRWPVNYVLNLSSDSIYAEQGARNATVRAAVEALPIRRGYFESIPLSRAVPQLNGAFVPATAGSPASVREFALPSPESVPHVFSAERVRSLVLINGRMSEVADDPAKSLAVARAISQEMGLGWTPQPDPKRKTSVIEQIRSGLFRAYFAKLLTDVSETGFGSIVEEQLAKDDPRGLTVQQWRQRDAEDKMKDALTMARKKGLTGADLQEAALAKVNRAKETRYTSKRWQDKALALALHEALVAFGPWGSCPLVCGNCLDISTDDPTKQPVHRCASKDVFRGRTIYIGRH